MAILEGNGTTAGVRPASSAFPRFPLSLVTAYLKHQLFLGTNRTKALPCVNNNELDGRDADEVPTENKILTHAVAALV
jgi:hypothetical protein